MIHSDRGIQYCCSDVHDVLKRDGVIQSMSRKGNCWDNAVAESFFATLKKELCRGTVYANLAEAKQKIFEYIEIDYNRDRFHSTNADEPPAEYEAMFWARQKGEENA
jgi:putative transposase